jgi:hypothetical protein
LVSWAVGTEEPALHVEDAVAAYSTANNVEGSGAWNMTGVQFPSTGTEPTRVLQEESEYPLTVALEQVVTTAHAPLQAEHCSVA